MERKKIVILILCVLAAFALVFLPGFSELQKLREENGQYLRRNRLLEEHNESLKSELKSLNKDPGYVEKKAREKLGIVKKGEIIYHAADQQK